MAPSEAGDLQLALDWSSYKEAGTGDAYADIPAHGGDFAKAVAVCINSHQCENDAKGVMCPSYRATQDPQLSTGGRVRLIKAALNGTDAVGGLGETPLARAMALCVGCKGCKRECENEVDMAMVKVEYLAQHHRHTKPPLRTRLLANLSRQLHNWECLKPLLGMRNRVPWLARLGERLLGLSAARRLPEPARQSYFNGHSPDLPAADNAFGEVVLLVDTFTDHFAPENARAASAVLRRAGYGVIIARPDPAMDEPDRPLCCGRTHIANGLVDQARREARRMLSVLLPHVEAGRPIVGLEPACLLAVRDDYRFLGLGPAADKVAAQAILFEEFIAREISAKRFAAPLKPVDTGGEPLLVHGHCHQKAVGAMKSMRKVLKAIPGLEFQLIESTCCGMAGSFGIEKEHADIAMQMAEQSLLPTLREQPRARVLANGFSCRHQIREGAARSATHLACLLQEAMA